MRKPLNSWLLLPLIGLLSLWAVEAVLVDRRLRALEAGLRQEQEFSSRLADRLLKDRQHYQRRLEALEARHDLLVAASRSSWAQAHRLLREGLLEYPAAAAADK